MSLNMKFVIGQFTMLGIFAVVTILVSAQAVSSNLDFGNVPKLGYTVARYDTETRVAKDGYWVESHHVVTEDGYILEINRIPNGRFKSGTIPPRSKPVVFLMHGLQSSALSYIFAGPGLSLAYLLADAGYDVWLGNGRGAINSRRHVRLDPDNKSDKREFFKYTFEDVAIKDIPTMIDYVLEVTKQKQLNYIGHSQGGTAFYVLNSLRPEYSKKFITVHLLAGVGYKKHFPNTVLSLAAISTDLILNFAVARGSLEILGPEINERIECSEDDKSLECTIQSLKEEMLRLLGDYELIAGASIYQYAHYGQIIRDRSFRRWNYYPLKNLQVYGSLIPPSYDLSLINVEDITLHYTLGDDVLSERDVLSMANDIPNAKVRKVARDNFTHTDFLTAPDSRELVSDYIIEKINEKNKRKIHH